MSQHSKLVFDWKQAEETIVWDIYREAEYKKFRTPANGEDSEDNETLPWYHRLFRPLYRTNRRTTYLSGFDNEPFLLIRKYIIWFQKSKWRIEDAKIVDPMALHRFFTNKIRNIAVFGLFTNIIFLLCLYAFANDTAIIADGSSSSSSSNSFFTMLRGYISTWMVCNALCVFHFIVLMNTSRIILRQWNIDADYMWLYLGRFVAFLRILIICQHTVYYLTENEERKCYGLHVHSLLIDKKYIFWYVFSCSMLDAIQGIVLSCMPFRWPWALAFSLLMMYQISMRTLTCFAHVDIPDNVRHKVTQGLLVFATVFFLMNVALVSYTFQRSLLASFSNTVSVSELAKNTRAMVNMLCTDVKLNVRQMLTMLQNLSQVSPPSLLTSASFAAIVEDMKESGTVINVAVDHLLFLAKVGEGRFEFSLMDRINLSTTLVEVCKDYKRKVTVDHRDVDLQVEIPNEIITTDTRCFHALVYYGLMAVDTLIQSFQSKDNMDSNNQSEKSNSSSAKQPQEPPHFLIRGHLEEATAASPPEVVALRIFIHFNLFFPTNVEGMLSTRDEEKRDFDINELKKLISNNGLIHSCCIVCNRLVQSYNGEFQFYPDRLEFTLPVLPTERLYRPHQDSNSEEPGTISNHASHNPHESHFGRTNSLSSFLTNRFSKDKDGGSRFNASHLSGEPILSSLGVTGVPLSELLQKYSSIYFTVPQMESLVTDAIRALLKDDPIQLMTYHVINSVDMKIRAVIFVQTWEAQQELIQAGFTGEIILCSEKVSYLDARQRNLFSFVLPLPPSQQDLRILTRFLRQKLEVLEIVPLKKQTHPEYQNNRYSVLSGRNSARENCSAGNLGTGRLYNSTDNTPRNLSDVHPDQSINNQIPINGYHGTNYMFTTAGTALRRSDRRSSWLMYLNPSPRSDSNSTAENISIRLSPPPPSTVFAEFLNFGSFPIPAHQLNNYAKWRFMNPGGDMFHHTTNAEFFSFFMILLLTYQYVSGLGSARTVAGSIFFGVVLLYRNSVYSTFERYVPYVVCWTIVSLVISVLSMTVSFSSMQQIWMKQMQYTSVTDLFENQRQVESAINNGLHIVFNIVITPILLKYYGDYLTWPFSFFAVITQLCRVIFYAVYMLDPFLSGLNHTIFIILLVHIFSVLLINVVSIEGLFRDEFLQLHDLILARSYLEKCLVLTRQLIQPLENMVDAQEATVQIMVKEAVAGRLWMQEPMIFAMNECQVAKLTTHQWMLELRLTKASWLMRQERSEIIGQMRAVLLRPFVLSLCRQIVDDYHAHHAIDPTMYVGNFSFAVRIAPELTQIRVDESLCRATITHICRDAIQQIEKHVHLGRRMCRIHRSENLKNSSNDINPQDEYDEVNSNKTVQHWKKQALMQHHLLLCVYPKSVLSPETGRLFRFADVRDMEVLVLSTAEVEGCHDSNGERNADVGWFVPAIGSRSSNIELKKITHCTSSQTQSSETFTNSVKRNSASDSSATQQKIAADVYAEYFAFTNNRDSYSNNNIYKENHDEESIKFVRRSRNYEDGVVCRHAQYRSYHRVLLPYLLTPHSSWFAEAITTSPQYHIRAAVNQTDIVNYFSRDERRQRHYANYMRQSSSFFLPALAAASASSLSDPSHVHTLFRTNSNNAGMFLNYPLKSNSYTSSPNSSFVDSPKGTPFSSLNSVVSLQNKIPTLKSNTITFRAPGMKVAIVLSFTDTFLRRQAVHNQVALGAVGWLGRLEMLKPPLMPQSCFLEAECIFIEYMSGTSSLNAVSAARVNPIHGMRNMAIPTNTSGADRYFAGETEQERIASGREYLRLVVQWLRFGGYEGVIIFLGDSTMESFMQEDTTPRTRSSWALEKGHNTSHDDKDQVPNFCLYHDHNRRVLRSDQESDAEAFALMMKRNVLNKNNQDENENDLQNKGKTNNISRRSQKKLPLNSTVYLQTAALADCYLTTPLTEEKLRSVLPECERRLVELALGVWNP